MDDIKTKYGY